MGVEDMSDNRNAREALERLYGKECFIERLHLRDTSKLKYTGKKQYQRMKKMTYHHIKKKEHGGRATVENGALLSNENHAWFHQQPLEEQARMNEMFQELKRQTDECTLVITDYQPSVEVHYVGLSPDQLVKQRYNRAKEKEEVRRKAEEYIDR